MEDHRIAVTLNDAIEMSGLSRSTLYLAFKDGTLVPRKAGKRTLIIVSELKAFINSLPKSTLKRNLGGRAKASAA